MKQCVYYSYVEFLDDLLTYSWTEIWTCLSRLLSKYKELSVLCSMMKRNRHKISKFTDL